MHKGALPQQLALFRETFDVWELVRSQTQLQPKSRVDVIQLLNINMRRTETFVRKIYVIPAA